MANWRSRIPGYARAARRRRSAQPRVLPVSLIVLVLSLLAISLVTACDASSETTTSVTKPSTTLSASSTTTLGVSELVLASTTLTKDSGILDVLVPAFTEAYPQHMVTVIALSSEEALKLGEAGDADVLLVHSPASEEIFMANGFGIGRRAVMHSDFIIVGPRDDPVGIKGMTDAAGAFAAIAGAQAQFFSRGDDSDFYDVEKGIWEAANVTPSGVWYQRTDQGMAETLVLADQRGGYALTDRATYLSARASHQLRILVQGDGALLNQYHVIAVEGAKNMQGAVDFMNWVTSDDVQRDLIAPFRFEMRSKRQFVQQLFVPNAGEVE